MAQPRLLLIIGGGIAAYKSLEFIRRARDAGYAVRAVMTRAATEFITPLAVGAITGDRVFLELFDRDDEHDIGHIRLSREADLVVIAPATADLMAKMAGGHADDLASTVLLASDKPILVAPAMNPHMWRHPATQRNAAALAADGVMTIGPMPGEMAEAGESGVGRMAEPVDILDAVQRALAKQSSSGALAGRQILVTAGPTHEPIDPVRYIANRSSGKQGYAIAEAAVRAGASVTLISGPTGLATPTGVKLVGVETAAEMLNATEANLPADVAVFTAAVADWRVGSAAGQKMKKTKDGPPTLELTENPDILATISASKNKRPPLVVGFAAETENVLEHATAKLERKGCDWIVANDVSLGSDIEGGVMGGDHNKVHLVRKGFEPQDWPIMGKDVVAEQLINEIASWLSANTDNA